MTLLGKSQTFDHKITAAAVVRMWCNKTHMHSGPKLSPKKHNPVLLPFPSFQS